MSVKVGLDHSDNNALEHELMEVIDDKDKTQAINYFMNKYFSGIHCPITAVNRYAFLPRETTAFTELMKKEIAERANVSEGNNLLGFIELERTQSINARDSMLASIRDRSWSQRNSRRHNVLGPAQHFGVGRSSRQPHLRPFQEPISHGANFEGLDSYGVSPFDPMQQLKQAHERMIGYGNPHESSSDSEDFGFDHGDFFASEKQKSEKQNQDALCEKRLVTLYEDVNAGMDADGRISSQITQVSQIDKVTEQFVGDNEQQKVTISFKIAHRLPEKLIMRDIDSLSNRLLEEIGAPRLTVAKEFVRDARGQITSFSISYKGLCVTSEFFPAFIKDVKTALYSTAADLSCQFNSLRFINSINRAQPEHHQKQQEKEPVRPTAENNVDNQAAVLQTAGFFARAMTSQEDSRLTELMRTKYGIADDSAPLKLRAEKAIRNAAANGQAEDLRFFLTFKDKLALDIDSVAPDKPQKMTALHHCVVRGTDQHVQCAKLLLDAGANQDIKNGDGHTVRGSVILGNNTAMQVLFCQQTLAEEGRDLRQPGM